MHLYLKFSILLTCARLSRPQWKHFSLL